MSSACEMVNVAGFVSHLNRMRQELTTKELEGFKVDEFVMCTRTGKMSKIHRFALSDGIYKADVKAWRQSGSALKGLMIMVGLFELEHIGSPDNELSYLRKLHTLPRHGM